MWLHRELDVDSVHSATGVVTVLCAPAQFFGAAHRLRVVPEEVRDSSCVARIKDLVRGSEEHLSVRLAMRA